VCFLRNIHNPQFCISSYRSFSSKKEGKAALHIVKKKTLENVSFPNNQYNGTNQNRLKSNHIVIKLISHKVNHAIRF